MLTQQIEKKKKKPDLGNSIASLKRVAVESGNNIAKERSNSALSHPNTTTIPEEEKSIKDYSIMSPQRQSNGTDADTKGFEGKKFKSRYIDNDGAWTRESVDDGYVEFKDYIKDRREGVDFGVSFNDKEFSASSLRSSSEPYEKDVLYGDEYAQYEADEDPIEYYYHEDDAPLEPYTIAGEYGETAGVGDFFHKVADTTLNVGGKVTGAMVKSVLYFAKVSPYYDNVVDVVRDIWEWGADHILRDRYDCQSSAWLLEHALQDNPSDQYRDNNSRIAWLVNTDKTYLRELDNAISKSNGKTIDTKISVTFEPSGANGKDLYFSLHNVDICVRGYKREDGKWIIHSTFKDQYDFTKLMWFDLEEYKNMSMMKALGMTANDIATISSWGDAVKPYWLYVDFYTTR